MTELDTTHDVTAGLAPHLVERCRVLKRSAATDGRFILYWMHHAVRGHENPALDVAIELGNRLHLPVLVYQGLGGRHRFNNDRHHQFIIEGARDAHRDISNREIRAVFHLAIDPGEPSPLPQLIAEAGVFVVEDYPAPPFGRWTEAMADRCAATVIAVDGHCLVPMRLQPRRFARAFEYRRHNEAEFARRLDRRWTDARVEVPPFDGGLPFDPLNLESADLTALCAQCAIDHGVPPVTDTVGGSDAGYARWQRFLTDGLPSYADKRNDAAVAWPQGVSRLSPYLHHGHVSPFRIAREAAGQGGRGADKFLDELLVWRELAFNFCFHTRNPESLQCLPDWAQATLNGHREDPRPADIDMDRLARSRSGDPLWDAAQTSLRIHGELHNNLRMTWAKAIPAWTDSPEQALRALIELNHRYALDGSDPNSYGGLLWTLGLFDRPFPEEPVSGQLRRRSTGAHWKRLDHQRYLGRVGRPSSGEPIDVAIIGAGISGLSAGRLLQDHGHRVTVFEKSRGFGGRAATRRYGERGFDHGAQYFTARDPAFVGLVEAWQQAGVVAPWPARMATVSDNVLRPSPDEQTRFVAVPGMSALGKYLAADLNVKRQTRVAPPRLMDSRWILNDEEGRDLGRYDALIVAAPAPQAAALLRRAAPAMAEIADGLNYAPMWAAMVDVYDDDPVGFDGLFVKQGPIGWAARNHGKPGRSGSGWMVHAGADWTRAQLEAPADDVAAMLTAALAQLLGLPDDRVAPLGAHRWLYSLVPDPLDVGALWAPEQRLAVCGDWCQGARIEGAHLSGVTAAARLLGHLNDRSREALSLSSAPIGATG